jgi:hypothetical protein
MSSATFANCSWFHTSDFSPEAHDQQLMVVFDARMPRIVNDIIADNPQPIDFLDYGTEVAGENCAVWRV